MRTRSQNIGITALCLAVAIGAIALMFHVSSLFKIVLGIVAGLAVGIASRGFSGRQKHGDGRWQPTPRGPVSPTPRGPVSPTPRRQRTADRPAAVPLNVRVFRGDLEITTFSSKPFSVRIGSGSECELRLNEPGVAEMHASLHGRDDRCIQVHQGDGPVSVNGKRMRQSDAVVLSDGDVIELAGLRLFVGVGWQPDENDPRVGTRLAGRLLTTRLGEGAHGTSYASLEPGHQLAIKRLHRCAPDGLLNDEALADYAERTRQAAAVYGEHSTAVVDTGRDEDGVAWIAEEYHKGSFWNLFFARRQPMENFVAQVCDVASVIAGLHERGLVHGNLKPGNIILAPGSVQWPRGRPVLTHPWLDATPVDEDQTTTRYLAPEVSAGAERNAATDLYALGAMLHFALTGQHADPANADTDQQTELFATAAIRPAMAAVIRAATAPEPARRIADVRTLINRLSLAVIRDHELSEFRGHKIGECKRCGERASSERLINTTMMDGYDANGQMVGGQIRDYQAVCFACGHAGQRTDHEAY